MAMSTKDYVAIANVIIAERSISAGKDEALNAITNITYSLADVFARDNARFNRETFYKACGMSTKEAKPLGLY